MNYQLRGRGIMAPDWAAIINELLRNGVTIKDIGNAIHMQITHRMLLAYRQGTQPAYWRGELLVAFWAKSTGRKVEDVPKVEVIRGHRVNRNQPVDSPRIGDIAPLVDWLKPKQVQAEAPKRRGRPPKKVEVVA